MIAVTSGSKMRGGRGARQLYKSPAYNGAAVVAAFYDALGLSQARLGALWGVTQQRISNEKKNGEGPVLHVVRALEAAGENAGQAIAVLSRLLRQKLMDIPADALWNRFRIQTARECEAEGRANAAQTALATDQSAEAYRRLAQELTAHAGVQLTLATTAEEIATRKETGEL